MHTYTLPISRRTEICKDTLEVAFDITHIDFSYKAGSYVRVQLHELFYDDPKGDLRNLSIVTSPHNKSELIVAFRKSSSGFKRTLEELPLGSQVSVTGPFATMSLPEKTDHPLVFIAGGIGITPFMSMMQFLEETKSSQAVTLIYANTDPSRAAYLDELQQMAARNSHITIIPKFGDIDTAFLMEVTKQLVAPLWYIAGPSAMVQVVKTILLGNQVAEGDIHMEEMSGYEGGVHLRSYLAARENTKKALSTTALNASQISGALLEALDKSALVAMTDVQGNISYVNNKFVEISQYSEDELLGQNHRILKSGYHTPEFYHALWSTITSGNTWRGEVKNKAKDGSFYWVDTVITPVLDSEGLISGYAAARFPITEKKKFAEVLTQALENEKRISEKLEKQNQEFKNAQVSLRKNIAELDKFQKLTVDRELKMIALKKTIRELQKQRDKNTQHEN